MRHVSKQVQGRAITGQGNYRAGQLQGRAGQLQGSACTGQGMYVAIAEQDTKLHRISQGRVKQGRALANPVSNGTVLI